MIVANSEEENMYIHNIFSTFTFFKIGCFDVTVTLCFKSLEKELIEATHFGKRALIFMFHFNGTMLTFKNFHQVCYIRVRATTHIFLLHFFSSIFNTRLSL